MATEPISGSPYIIICNGRIGVQVANGLENKIVAVSGAAASLAKFMQSHFDEFQVADLQDISTLQHQLMDYVNGGQMTHAQVKQKIQDLIDAMYALEHKYT